MGGVAIHFHAAETPEGRAALAELTKIYGQAKPDAADFIVALGGDGTLLEALHRYHALGKPFYGMNRGSVGFLLNTFRADGLPERLNAAQSVTLIPLRMTVRMNDGTTRDAIAFNEASLIREERQAAKIGISVNDVERLPELICDGILVATPAGSTAYNLSAHGPIIPLGANLLALTPISAFRPRRWRGALLPQESTVHFTIRETDKRPVSATADFTEIRNVQDVKVASATDISVRLLFDPDYDLEERVLKEQFAP